MIPVLLGLIGKASDIKTQIGAAGAGLSAIPWNSSWDAEVQSECTDALNAYDPPTKAEMDSAVSGIGKHVKMIASGYLSVSSPSLSTGTGMDNQYYDITVSGVTDYANCFVLLQGGVIDPTAAPDELIGAAYARMTSATNLRIFTPDSAALQFRIYYYLLETERT